MLKNKVTKLQEDGFLSVFPEPRKTSETVLVAVIQEAWIGGVSLWRVAELRNGEIFFALREAHILIEQSRIHYSQIRPLPSLG